MPTLAQKIRDLLCEVARGGYKRCECERELGVQVYRCVYGTCEIYRCTNCHRVIRAIFGECHFPYTE